MIMGESLVLSPEIPDADFKLSGYFVPSSLNSDDLKIRERRAFLELGGVGAGNGTENTAKRGRHIK